MHDKIYYFTLSLPLSVALWICIRINIELYFHYLCALHSHTQWLATSNRSTANYIFHTDVRTSYTFTPIWREQTRQLRHDVTSSMVTTAVNCTLSKCVCVEQKGSKTKAEKWKENERRWKFIFAARRQKNFFFLFLFISFGNKKMFGGSSGSSDRTNTYLLVCKSQQSDCEMRMNVFVCWNEFVRKRKEKKNRRRKKQQNLRNATQIKLGEVVLSQFHSALFFFYYFSRSKSFLLFYLVRRKMKERRNSSRERKMCT